MKKEERIVDLLMDDDEIGIIEEVEREKSIEAGKERDLTSNVPYRNVVIEVGSDIKLRVLDVAIVIVAAILAYLIFTEIL